MAGAWEVCCHACAAVFPASDHFFVQLVSVVLLKTKTNRGVSTNPNFNPNTTEGLTLTALSRVNSDRATLG